MAAPNNLFEIYLTGFWDSVNMGAKVCLGSIPKAPNRRKFIHILHSFLQKRLAVKTVGLFCLNFKLVEFYQFKIFYKTKMKAVIRQKIFR